MIPTLLFVAFVAMMLIGVPIGAALGLAGAACIALANSDAQWFGLLAVPQNFYAGLGKYPLLAIPMLASTIRTGALAAAAGVLVVLVLAVLLRRARGRIAAALVAPLAERELRMEQRDSIAESSGETGDDLRSQSDLGNQDRRALPSLECRLGGRQVDPQVRTQQVLHPVDEQPANVVHVHVGQHHVSHGRKIDAGGLQSLDQLTGPRQVQFRVQP